MSCHLRFTLSNASIFMHLCALVSSISYFIEDERGSIHKGVYGFLPWLERFSKRKSLIYDYDDGQS